MLRISLVVVFVCAIVVCVFCETHRNDKLFKQYPLNDNLARFYEEQQYENSNNALFSAIHEAIQTQEQEKLEKITNAMETKLNSDTSAASSTDGDVIAKSIFHNYESEAIAIYGTADFKFLAEHLKDENYKPIFLQGGEKAIVTLWIINHKDTSLGSYKQLMITTTVASKNLGYTLGVTYDGSNAASLLFPAFGKLSNQARLFVLSSLYDREIGKRFGQQITGVQSSLAAAKIEKTTESDSAFVNFLFTDNNGNLLVQGKVEEDNSWTSYLKTGWKIFRALGLSGILDLRNLAYITMKTVGSKQASSSPKWTSFHMDMKQQFNELNNYELKLGDVGVAKLLKDMKFEPSMVVRMPQFQYAVTSPRDQVEDNEYTNTKELRFVNEKGEPTNLNDENIDL